MGRLFVVLAIALVGCATLGEPETVTRDEADEPGNPGDDTPEPLPQPDPDPQPTDDPDPEPTPDPDPDCVETPVALLSNGDFENGSAAWLESSGFPLVVDAGELPVAPRSGNFATWFGGLTSGGTQILAQPVAIPTGAVKLEVTAHARIATDDTEPGADIFRFYLISADFVPLELLGLISNSDVNADYAALTMPATAAYPGQTVYLHMQSDLDGALNTNFFVDDVAVTATVCP